MGKLTVTILVCVVVCGLFCGSGWAEPVGTVFAYQGRLQDACEPADGVYDFEFSLYEDATEPNQIGSTISVDDEPVADGYFTVQLDFGSGIFTGEARWLEIAVRPGAETGVYSMLSPRQEVTPTPYALYAGSGGGGWVDDGAVVRLETSSDIVGIGTADPCALLHVHSGVSGEIAENIAGLFVESSGISNSWYVLQTASAGGGKSFSVTNAGNVGIGTTSPLADLHLQSSNATMILQDDDDIDSYAYLKDYSPTQLLVRKLTNSGTSVIDIDAKPLDTTSDSRIRFFRFTDTAGSKRAIFYRGDGTYDADASIGVDGEDSYFQIYGGNIGIGTTTPTSKLEVSDYESQVITNDDTFVANIHSYHNNGLLVHTGYNDGVDIARFSSIGFGYVEVPRMVIKDTGNVGVGTTSPDAKLDVNGQVKISGGSPGAGKVLTSDASGLASWQTLASGSDSDWVVSGSNMYSDVTGNVGIGTTNPSSKLTVQGNILIEEVGTGVDLLELGAGLDYAEGFDVTESKEIAPGTVLVIDSENPGNLTMSSESYDSRVAGIVAGARGLGSGVRLGVGQFECDVALAGRVYCNVDATGAGVEPGDLLTTSVTPGYAMKATDCAKTHGAILGKAMERLAKGEKGQILVLVTLQ